MSEQISAVASWGQAGLEREAAVLLTRAEAARAVAGHAKGRRAPSRSGNIQARFFRRCAELKRGRRNRASSARLTAYRGQLHQTEHSTPVSRGLPRSIRANPPVAA